MLESTYAQLAARENSYWWHVARRELIAALLKRHGVGAGARVADFGCGTGAYLALAREIGATFAVGLDRSSTALAFSSAKVNGGSFVRADLNGILPFADGSFDVCTFFNVLYHSWIVEPRAVLEEAARVLAPGGLLLVTEPAFPLLARTMDDISLGRRRFRPDAFRQMCEQAGFDVVTSSCFTSFGVPAVLAIKALERLRTRRQDDAAMPSDMKPLRPILNRLALAVARTENRLILHGWRMSAGVTLCCLCRKRA